MLALQLLCNGLATGCALGVVAVLDPRLRTA